MPVCYFENDHHKKYKCSYENKKNILMKNAFYTGYRNVIGNPDGKTVTKFQSSVYFEHYLPEESLCTFWILY